MKRIAFVPLIVLLIGGATNAQVSSTPSVDSINTLLSAIDNDTSLEDAERTEAIDALALRPSLRY